MNHPEHYHGNGPFRRVVTIYYGQSSTGYGGFAIYTTMHPAMHQRGGND